MIKAAQAPAPSQQGQGGSAPIQPAQQQQAGQPQLSSPIGFVEWLVPRVQQQQQPQERRIQVTPTRTPTDLNKWRTSQLLQLNYAWRTEGRSLLARRRAIERQINMYNHALRHRVINSVEGRQALDDLAREREEVQGQLEELRRAKDEVEQRVNNVTAVATVLSAVAGRPVTAAELERLMDDPEVETLGQHIRILMTTPEENELSFPERMDQEMRERFVSRMHKRREEAMKEVAGFLQRYTFSTAPETYENMKKRLGDFIAGARQNTSARGIERSENWLPTLTDYAWRRGASVAPVSAISPQTAQPSSPPAGGQQGGQPGQRPQTGLPGPGGGGQPAQSGPTMHEATRGILNMMQARTGQGAGATQGQVGGAAPTQTGGATPGPKPAQPAATPTAGGQKT